MKDLEGRFGSVKNQRCLMAILYIKLYKSKRFKKKSINKNNNQERQIN